MAAKIIAFLVIFIVVDRVIALIFHLIAKVVGLISFIPFLKTINRIAGLILGLTEGILIVGLIIYIIIKFLPNTPFVSDNLATSSVANFLVAAVSYMSSWAMSDALTQVQGILKL